MATTPLQREKGEKAVSPGVGYRTPVAMEPRVGSALKDEAIWKRLRDAGFDEGVIQKRDKAALIAYIGKLESEVFALLLLYLSISLWICIYTSVLWK